MSYTSIVFKAMIFDQEYSPQDLKATTHLRIEDVTRALNMLEKGLMITKTKGGRLVKQRKYKSNQRQLSLGR